MSVESICWREALHLARRSVKYWHLVGKVYLESIRDPQSAKVFRAAYFFCRHIDDVLDGDRKITADPEAYVFDILNAMDRKCLGPTIVELYRFAIGPIKEMADERDNPKSYFKEVIEAMLFDYQRAKERTVLTRPELEQYYNHTFTPVTNLALIIAGSSLRTSQTPEVVTTQGHIYTLRDLKKDLEQGIINIPLEELEKSGESGDSISNERVRSNPLLVSWMDAEIRKYQSELAILRKRLSDSASRKVCLPLIWQMETYCKLYQIGLH